MDKQVVLEKAHSALVDLKPFLEADGGDIEIIDVTDEGVLNVRLLGACKSCNMSKMTLRAGLLEAVQKVCPEVTGIEAIEAEVEQV